MTIVLSGKLPNGNGLSAIEEALIANPQESQVVIALVACKQVTSHAQSGDVVVTAQIIDIEAYPNGTSGWSAVQKLLVRQREHRTGKVPLPIDTLD